MSQLVHGLTGLAHGATPGCNEQCNNLECAAGLTHDVCEVDCYTSRPAVKGLIKVRDWMYRAHATDDNGE